MNKINYEIKVIDDFLDKDDYNELCNLRFDTNFENEVKVYHNEINDDNIINQFSFTNNLVDESKFLALL